MVILLNRIERHCTQMGSSWITFKLDGCCLFLDHFHWIERFKPMPVAMLFSFWKNEIELTVLGCIFHEFPSSESIEIYPKIEHMWNSHWWIHCFCFNKNKKIKLKKNVQNIEWNKSIKTWTLKDSTLNSQKPRKPVLIYLIKY